MGNFFDDDDDDDDDDEDDDDLPSVETWRVTVGPRLLGRRLRKGLWLLVDATENRLPSIASRMFNVRIPH